MKTTSFAPSTTQIEPTPPGTADRDNADLTNLMASGALRESPPPVVEGNQMPVGAILSPPESTQNSSDDEEDKSRGRTLENLAELQAAIRIIEQHRSSSPTTQAGDIARANKALTPLVTDDKPSTEHMERSVGPAGRKILHARSNTDSAVFIDLRQDESTSVSVSDEDSDDEMGPRRKPPMLRKKSGELVRPALRPPSRRRPSSMPGTPTFSKAVHFDSHLEHVRHFLQVDRPLAVSAGSSPVESYESDSEYPFDEETSNVRTPPFEWEIIVANFPPETPERLNLPIRVEKVFLSSDNKNLIGTVAVANLGFQKTVIARFTLDYWKTTSEVVAEFNNDVRRKQLHDGYDRFNFNIKLADQANLEAKTMFFCVKYHVNGQEYWDNNNNINFQIDFRKKAKPQNGKRGLQGAASRPANGLPRSNKKPLPNGLNRPRTMPVTFDDFADGFDSKYDFKNFAVPVNDFLGDANPPLRLKGVKSAVSLAVDDLSRKAPSPNGQAFANRYSFGASMKAAMKAAGVPAAPQHKSAPQPPPKNESVAPHERAPVPGTDSPRPAGVEKPVLASQSYNELLDKYCFVSTSLAEKEDDANNVKSSVQ